MCNDAHYILSGYGKYGREVLNRLADTGDFELAELACYGEANDKKHRDDGARWMYYANAVPENHHSFSLYNS